ncbi:carbonic anhydrase [Nitriliruptor alkaliphilus]|uniref:carbonic anhydrase n=1 Tax=Nitriliruptor alkaliphilus TaxID=427918 RepID=UPI000697EC74|nr:carbonic anhydrase [Nitriliruptor alkaliphilus]
MTTISDGADTDPVAGLTDLLEAAAPAGVAGRPDSARPARRLAVVTCMDARIDALGDLRLDHGDAHVIRVAGARIVEDVVRSLHLSTAMLGVRGCLVLGHTSCGLHDADGTLAGRLRALDPMRRDWASFSDPAEAVAEDVGRLLAWPHRPDPWAVAGGVIDVADGSVQVVVPPTSA